MSIKPGERNTLAFLSQLHMQENSIINKRISKQANIFTIHNNIINKKYNVYVA